MRGLLCCLSLLLAFLQPTDTLAGNAAQPSYANSLLHAQAVLHNQNTQDYYFIQHDFFEITDDDDSDDTERKSSAQLITSSIASFVMRAPLKEISANNSITQIIYTQTLALFILLKVFRI